MDARKQPQNDIPSNFFYRHLQTLLRSLWLQILLPEGPVKESPKVVITQDWTTAILRSIVHIVPFGGALTLIVFNLTGFFFTNYSPDRNSKIQFAAKFLEVMIQTSIGTIFLEIIRHKMLGQHNIPLGSLFGPLHINTVSYLWSLDFWGSLKASWLGKRQRFLLFLITFVMIVLAALAGPSGAVLMIPRPQQRFVSQYDLVFDSPSVGLPSKVALADFSGNYSNPSSFRDAFAQLEAQLNYNKPGFVQGEIDIYDNYDNSIDSRPHRVMYISNDGQATAPMYKLARGMQRHLWTIDVGEVQATTFDQPQVQYSCWKSPWNRTGDLNLPNGNATHVTFRGANSEINNLLTYSEFFANASKLNDTYFWLALDAPSSQSTVSSLLVHGPRYGIVSSGEPNGPVWYLEACNIDARWITASVNYTANGALIVSNIDKNSESLIDEDSSARPIFLSSDLVQNLTSIYLQQQKTFDFLNVALALALSNFVPPDATQEWWAGKSDLTNTITEILNAIPDANGIWTTSRWTDPHELSRVPIRSYNYGYGYDSGPVTVKLSLVVILLYCAIVAVFLVYRIASGRSSVTWDTMSELFMLALNSHRPLHMQNTSAGVSTLQVLAEPVSVRANDEGSLEVLFLRDEKNNTVPGVVYRRVRPNTPH